MNTIEILTDYLKKYRDSAGAADFLLNGIDLKDFRKEKYTLGEFYDLFMDCFNDVLNEQTFTLSEFEAKKKVIRLIEKKYAYFSKFLPIFKLGIYTKNYNSHSIYLTYSEDLL
jgi:hypothetical protein